MLAKKALAFATVAHAGVVRKGSGEPYVAHCARVAAPLAALGFPDHVVAAAYLHDVVEDTVYTDADLVKEFGPDTAALVAEVTNPVLPVLPGNRAWRKGIEVEHLKGTSYYGASIKLADIADNANGSVARPAFAKMYLPELVARLAVVGHGHPELVAMAKAAVAKALATIEK